MNLQDALEEFLLARRAEGRRPATIQWYRSILTAFVEAQPKDLEVDAVTPTLIRKYIVDLRERSERYLDAKQKPRQEGGLANESIRGHITALHSFWNWAAVEYRLINPMGNISRPERKQSSPRAIRPEDFVKLFDTAYEPRDKALLAFLADTGVRLGGLIGLQVEQVDFDKRRAIVTEKRQRTRTVVFTGFTRILLLRYLEGRETGALFLSFATGEGLTAWGVYELLKRLKKKAGVTGDVNPHSFRHRFAVGYMQAGGEGLNLAKLMGDDIRTINDYYMQFAPDELAVLHEKYSPLLRMLKDTNNLTDYS